MKKVLDRFLMLLVTALFVWMIIVFIGDVKEANRPVEQATYYYKGGD